MGVIPPWHEEIFLPVIWKLQQLPWQLAHGVVYGAWSLQLQLKMTSRLCCQGGLCTCLQNVLQATRTVCKTLTQPHMITAGAIQRVRPSVSRRLDLIA